jgi:hypothetical protein
LLGKTEKAAIKYMTCNCGHWRNENSVSRDHKQIKRDELYKEATQENDFRLTKKQY